MEIIDIAVKAVCPKLLSVAVFQTTKTNALAVIFLLNEFLELVEIGACQGQCEESDRMRVWDYFRKGCSCSPRNHEHSPGALFERTETGEQRKSPPTSNRTAPRISVHGNLSAAGHFSGCAALLLIAESSRRPDSSVDCELRESAEVDCNFVGSDGPDSAKRQAESSTRPA